MTPEAAYEKAKELVSEMYGVGADKQATEAARVAVADSLLAASSGAAEVERERCAGILSAFDPAPDYQADGDGEEHAVPVTWDAVRQTLIDRIREGEQP